MNNIIIIGDDYPDNDTGNQNKIKEKNPVC